MISLLEGAGLLLLYSCAVAISKARFCGANAQPVNSRQDSLGSLRKHDGDVLEDTVEKMNSVAVISLAAALTCFDCIFLPVRKVVEGLLLSFIS